MAFELKRIVGYMAGFILFYAPFALAQNMLLFLLTGKFGKVTVHDMCLRIQIEHFLDGKLWVMPIVQIISVLILLLVAFLFGPVFCGFLCPAGAIGEYISRLFPDKFKVSWNKYIDIIAVRYGMLFGFVILPFFNGVLACSYCNFFVFDLFFNYFIFGHTVSLTTTLILTLILWVVVFGIFTKGGRGYCNFLCPVGAAQNFVYWIGRRFSFTYKIKIKQNQCIGCFKCVRACPMEALSVENNKVRYNFHHCIVCNICTETCPVKAITYTNKGDIYEK